MRATRSLARAVRTFDAVRALTNDIKNGTEQTARYNSGKTYLPGNDSLRRVKMNIGAFHGFSIFTPFHVNLPDASTQMAEWTMGIRSLHSQGNIKVWSSYLPRECVNTMIKLGGDRTT
jgi:hypothetical protein